MRSLLLCLSLLVLSCLNAEEIRTDKDGNMDCYYKDTLVFSGNILIAGQSLDLLDLNGTWQLCEVTDGLTCIISLKDTE